MSDRLDTANIRARLENNTFNAFSLARQAREDIPRLCDAVDRLREANVPGPFVAPICTPDLDAAFPDEAEVSALPGECTRRLHKEPTP
jgi:hypothetical protein